MTNRPNTSPTPMTNALLDQWIDALRSGEYQQARGTFRDGSCYCALGVFLDLTNPEGWALDGEKYWHPDAGRHLPRFFRPYAQNLVADWNDLDHKSFAEIADLIEEHRHEFTTGAEVDNV